MLAELILVAEFSMLQDRRIACGFETGSMQLGNKRLRFAFKLSHSPCAAQCSLFWGLVLHLLNKIMILRVNGFLMILNENIHLDSERFIWRR